MIRNKAITRERVTAEEWRKANETSHIVFPNRDSEWSAVLERAVHNDFMYGALDASRAAGRIDQEYINPRDRKSTPWGDQQSARAFPCLTKARCASFLMNDTAFECPKKREKKAGVSRFIIFDET